MTIEKCIVDLASDFSIYYKNYRVEEEIRSKLAEYLRHEPEFQPTNDGHNLVRVQFPKWDNPRAHFDVVILTKNTARQFAIPYGKSVARCLEKFKSRAIFELKQKVWINDEEEKASKDIKRLREFIEKGKTQKAYMLIFLHSEYDDAYKEDKIIKKYLKYTIDCPNLNIYFIFRETPGFILSSGKISYI